MAAGGAVAGLRVHLRQWVGTPMDRKLLALLRPAMPARRPGSLASARAAPLGCLADAGPGTLPHVVSEVLGHASIAVTKDVYGHLLEDDKRATESMSRALFGGLTCSRGSQRGSQNDKKARRRAGNGPVTWALGETRTLNLLIRSHVRAVRPVRPSLSPQFRVHRVSLEDSRVRCRPASP
jgi:hypothetical protein